MSLIFADAYQCSGLDIHSPQTTIVEIHKRLDAGHNLGQILFDLDIEGYNMEEFK